MIKDLKEGYNTKITKKHVLWFLAVMVVLSIIGSLSSESDKAENPSEKQQIAPGDLQGQVCMKFYEFYEMGYRQSGTSSQANDQNGWIDDCGKKGSIFAEAFTRQGLDVGVETTKSAIRMFTMGCLDGHGERHGVAGMKKLTFPEFQGKLCQDTVTLK